jgi:5-methylcytosine-specific restriction endonuclease McrA
VDHTVPYPLGPTHSSNLKCLCRKHHLLKTFWAGANGWRDEQRSDGTVIWIAPTGQRYTTRPGSRLLFPGLCLPTGELPSAPEVDRLPSNRGVMMPARRRTREHDRVRRIAAERALNSAHVAERNQPPPF